MKATIRSRRRVYGIAKQHFASLEESQAASIDGFSWTSPENRQDFPWLFVDDLYVVLGDFKDEIDNISYCTVCVCDGSIVDDVSICGCDNVTRYCIVGDTTEHGNDTYIHEFEYDGEFAVNRLTIHYKTAVRPGAPDLRLVTSVEYAGRQIYSAGRIVENCTMPSVGDLGTGEQVRVESSADSYACDYMRDYTICNGWYKADGDYSHAWKLLARENAPQTVVIPAFVDEIADDAFANRDDPMMGLGPARVYVREGFSWGELHHVIDTYTECHIYAIKVPQSLCWNVFEEKEDWRVIENGFFSGSEVQESEYLFKKSHGGHVRWLELRPREFQYICSLAFGLPREECDEVGGRWLFTRSLGSGNLLLRLAMAFMEGREVEQDLPMALRCCEQAIWCAIGDGVPFAPGEVLPGTGIEVGDVRQFNQDYEDDLCERANGLKEEVLTHFQRLEIDMFERRVDEYRIPDRAFEGREDLRDVLLPDELCDKNVVVGRYAFARCTNLRSITVVGMKDGFCLERNKTSFLGCNSLSDRMQYSPDGSKLLLCQNAPEECTVCGHVRCIESRVFCHDVRMRHFTWDMWEDDAKNDKDGSRFLGDLAFAGCCNLYRVRVEGRKVVIRPYAFKDCRSLREFEFGSMILMPRLILEGCNNFRGCESLCRIGTIRLQDGLGYIAIRAEGDDPYPCSQFEGCRMLSETPPLVAAQIPDEMFKDCESLREVRCIIADDDFISSIQKGSRSSFNEPTDIDLSIGDSAFAHCHSLIRFKCCRMMVSLSTEEEDNAVREVELIEAPPPRVEFKNNAFHNCRMLSREESSFDRPDAEFVAWYVAPTAFSGCPEFEGFVEGNDNEAAEEFEIGGPEDLLMEDED